MNPGMSTMRVLALAAVLLLGACAHRPLSGADLDRVKSPAFVSRIEENAGPRSLVFREDDRYRPKLKKLDTREADRRLTLKLGKAVTRFELSDRLRTSIRLGLPKTRPWNHTVDPARVASALESYLVDEVPANMPDFDLLKPLGADAVVEIVIEGYGMKSDKGAAYAFLDGHARLFRLDSGAELWRTPFQVDGLTSARPALDPFLVAKEPERFRLEMVELLDGVAAKLAEELSPRERQGQGEVKGSPDDLAAPPDDTNRTGKPPASEPVPKDELGPGELPAPDPRN